MPDKSTNTDGIQISCSTQTSCSRCYTVNNEQNSFLITDSSSQSRHKQAVGKYITNLPMEINMKNFDFRLSSTYTANNTLISHLQIDHYSIYKIQLPNIKSKPPQKRKKLKKYFIFRISLCSFDFPVVSILVIQAWNSNKVTQSQLICDKSLGFQKPIPAKLSSTTSN